MSENFAALRLEDDRDLKLWYTSAGTFMRLRERAKFELLKVLFILKRALTRFARHHRLGDLVFYLELDEILKLTVKNRDKFRLLALQRKALFKASEQNEVKEVIIDFHASPFMKNDPLSNKDGKMRYNFSTGKSIFYGYAEGICLVAKSNEEYLQKLAEYRSENIENIIGVFKSVELSYPNLGTLKGFITEKGRISLARGHHRP